MDLREARTSDLEAIYQLLDSAGLPVMGVEDHRSNFIVLDDGDAVVGCVGLELYGDEALLRSLAVKEPYRNRGNGVRLYDAVVAKAKSQHVRSLILLTETAEVFFRNRGFEVVSRDTVAEEIRHSVEFETCCPDSAVCMMKRID